MPLDGRVIRVQFGPAAGPLRDLQGIEIAFSVDMDLSAEPNSASITIHQVAPDSFGVVESGAGGVRLIAGHVGQAQLIFQGTPITENGVEEINAPPLQQIRIRAKDGGTRFTSQLVDLSLDPDVTVAEVLDEIVAQSGLTVARAVFPDPTLAVGDGFQWLGPAQQALDRLAQVSSTNITRRDGSLVIMPIGGDTGEQVQRLTTGTGLLSSSKRSNGKGSVRAILSPTMRPGKRFEIESKQLNGTYVAERVGLRGSLFGSSFIMQIEARPVAV